MVQRCSVLHWMSQRRGATQLAQDTRKRQRDSKAVMYERESNAIRCAYMLRLKTGHPSRYHSSLSCDRCTSAAYSPPMSPITSCQPVECGNPFFISTPPHTCHNGTGRPKHCLSTTEREDDAVYQAPSLISCCSCPGPHAQHPAKNRKSLGWIRPSSTLETAAVDPDGPQARVACVHAPWL